MQADKPLDKLPSGALRLLQITDPHIFGDTAGGLLGVDTRVSLSQVIEHALEAVPAPDAVLLTGDIVHDGTEAGYAAARAMLKRLPAPVYCLPGNHDERTQMKLLCGDNVHTDKRIPLGPWQILMLDSVIEDGEGGNLSNQELDTLERALADHPGQHTLICLHHHPVPVGSRWLDGIGLANRQELFAILERHANARCVLWGHIHQVYDEQREGLRLLGSPSTCVQFMPGTDDFEVDAKPPGYRWLSLLPNGEIQTQVYRVEHISAALEVDSFGY